MVALSMSHRYSTGSLISTILRTDAKGRTVASVMLRDRPVDGILEDRHVHAFRLAAEEQGPGASILMERDATWDTWTVHHVSGSPVWAETAEPRIRPVPMPWLDQAAGPRLAA
jgi:hypothetical protein